MDSAATRNEGSTAARSEDSVAARNEDSAVAHEKAGDLGTGGEKHYGFIMNTLMYYN